MRDFLKKLVHILVWVNIGIGVVIILLWIAFVGGITIDMLGVA